MRKTFLACIILFSNHYCQADKVVLHSREGAGFFAELNTIVQYIVDILFNDPAGKEIDIQWTEEFFPYKDGKKENGWNAFFEPIGLVQLTKGINCAEIIHSQNCMDQWKDYNAFYDYRLAMNKIVNRYFKIKKEIVDEINAFYTANMEKELIIGVHVRFSKKHDYEKPSPVTILDYFRAINLLIKDLKVPYKIYLATDSNYVLRMFKRQYKKKLIYIDAIRSSFNQEVHLMFENPQYWYSHPQEFHQKKPGYKGGKDALMDCILLSRCNYLIHTTSNVSSFATFYNPDIQSIYLPKNIPYMQRLCSVCLSNNKWYHKEF